MIASSPTETEVQGYISGVKKVFPILLSATLTSDVRLFLFSFLFPLLLSLSFSFFSFPVHLVFIPIPCAYSSLSLDGMARN